MGSDIRNVEPLHFDCVVCQARCRPRDPGDEVLVLLALAADGHTLEDIMDDLCGEHHWYVRRTANEIARKPLEGA